VELANLHCDEQIIISEEHIKEHRLKDTEMDGHSLYSTYTTYNDDGIPIHYVPNERIANVIENRFLEARSSERIYDAAKPHFQILRDVFTPRVLEFGYEPELAEALIAVEEAASHWASTLKLIKDEWGLEDEDGWMSAAEFLRACAELVDRTGV
jgi:hypothetical protein